MKKLLLVSAIALVMSGCESTNNAVISSTANTVAATAKSCNYSAIAGTEYKILDGISPIVGITYGTDTSSKKVDLNLLKNGFKFTGEASSKIRPELFKKDAYLTINGETLHYSAWEHAKIVTPNCETAWVERGLYPHLIVDGMARTDSATLTKADYIEILGGKNTSVVVASAITPEYDKFKDTYTYAGVYTDSSVLRVWKIGGKFTKVQLYADLTFYKDWGNVQSATDEYGNNYSIKKIGSDVDCKSKYTGCKLTETVILDLDKSALEKGAANGFEIKFYGSKERTISVNAYKVRQMLETLKAG